MLQKTFESIVRNWAVAIPVVLVMAALLTLGHTLLGVWAQAQTALAHIEQKFSITVYLKDDADPFEVGKLITALQQRPDVAAPVVYTSKEAAWKLMSETFSLDASLLQKYRFSLPASLTITPAKPQAAATIEAFLAQTASGLLKTPAVKQQQQNTTRQMAQFIEGIKAAVLKTLYLFAFLFAAAAALMLASTIHLSIASRHREISVMKLVGASQQTILTPFVAEGVVLSLTAFALHTLLLAATAGAGPLGQDRWQLNALIGELVFLTAYAAAISYLTARFHLRKKSFFA